MKRFSKPAIPVESWPGLVLLVCVAVALAIANSPLGSAYFALLKAPIGPVDSALTMPLSGWIKNGLMALFFFYAGLELKREQREGVLADVRSALLPAVAAVGGMAAPALIYLLIADDPALHPGWAIPAATDIAFALGVLSLLEPRVPGRLQAFLLAVAVVDDLGAILIVALAYTSTIDWTWLAWSGGWCILLAVLNRTGVSRLLPYALLGAALWLSLQYAGINPTISGVLVAAFVPMHDRAGKAVLHPLENRLRPWVLFGVMPVFALANAGVAFEGDLAATLLHPVTLGIGAGLVLGKPLGIVAATLLASRVIGAALPGTRGQLVGLGLLAGIGFTMSLFIGALAFADPALAAPVRLGVYGGSLLAALAGLAILHRTLPSRAQSVPDADPSHPFIAADE